VTADAEVAELNARRAKQYANEAAIAVDKARTGLNNAGEVARQAYELLSRSRSVAADLSGQGELMSQAENPGKYAYAVEESSTTAGGRVGMSEDMLRDVRRELDSTRQQLRTGRRAVEQLSRLPGRRSDLSDGLTDRLDKLEDLVHYADGRATEVAGQLAVARGNVEPMASQSRSGDLRVTADTVRSTGTQAGRNLEDAQDGLRRLDGDLAVASPELSEAERESAELDRIVRAASNPTQASQQRAPGSASEEGSFNLRPGEANRQNDYGR